MNLRLHFVDGPAAGTTTPMPSNEGAVEKMYVVPNGTGGWQPSSIPGQGLLYARVGIESVGKQRNAYYKKGEE